MGGCPGLWIQSFPVWFLIYRYTSSWLAGLLGSGLFLISPIVMDIVVSAFSEGFSWHA